MRSTTISNRCVVLLLCCACGGGAAPATPDAAPANRSMALFASVENQNEFDAMIYAYRGGRWTRVGLVEPNSTRLLPFRWDQSDVRFVIELLGNDDVTDRAPDEDARKVFAADVRGSAPCHLTGRMRVEPDLILVLVVGPEVDRNAGRSRCQPRR